MAVVSGWVRRFAPLVGKGEVLDLACGNGRHARLLASLGHPVLAVDRDPAALAAASGPGIVTQACELEDPALAWPFAPGRFAAIVVTNYLHRPLLAALAGSLAPNGLLMYETFAAGNAEFGRPGNPAFLLEEGELLDFAGASGLRVLGYEHGYTDQPKPAMVQRLCAAGRAYAFAYNLKRDSSQQ